MNPQVNKKKISYKGDFLLFETIDWTDKNGNDAQWESVSRTSNDNGIVSIVPILIPSRRYVVIKSCQENPVCLHRG